MVSVESLSIKLFADGADLDGIMEMYANPMIQGFTTNPTLMRQVGVEDYEVFGKSVLEKVIDRPVSLEVFADEFDEMERQALKIASWGPNVNVKIPITNTKGESAADLIERLSAQGVIVNVTAMMTLEQVQTVCNALSEDTPAIVSVFAGRIADTGVDPIPHMAAALKILQAKPKAELLWASPREFLNLFQANDVGCHIITMTNSLLAKLGGTGKDLDQFSLETVQMFYRDASSAGYTL
jgi:transaldolase